MDCLHDAPTELLTNGISNPLAVDRDCVLFTWRMNHSRNDAYQTAYRIIAASSLVNLQKDDGDLWDSGKVHSSRSACIEYEGVELKAATRSWWKVMLWDQDGIEGAWSDPASFDTGIACGEWQAEYIWDGTSNENNFAYFRKTFRIDKTVMRAKVYVSAHNDYMLFLNGRRLGMGPARSNPVTYGQYDAYDVTSLLSEGENVLAAMGHWHGVWKDSGINATPAFILEAPILFDDQTSLLVKTDATWKTQADTPFVEADPVYFGGAGGARNRAAIKYDARKEMDGWQSAGYDDAGWEHAAVVHGLAYKLYAQLVQRQEEHLELEPVRVRRNGCDWIAEFDRCICGWPKLTMRNHSAGDKVRVSYYQMPFFVGHAGWDEYICRGGGTETWTANFGRHTSFYMLKITGYRGELSAGDVRAVWAYSGADAAGRFECSDELLNAVYEMSERSARQNVQQGIISVDANREQSPWTGDSWNLGCALLYNHKNTMILDKIVKDYAFEQMDNGDFHACSPAECFRIWEWSMYWPMILWEQYLFSGNVRLLRDMYPKLTLFLDLLRQYTDTETHLINPPHGNFTEGGRISDYAGGSMESGGWNVATNSQYYENLRIASQISAILGKAKEAQSYVDEAESVKNAINERLFSEQGYLSKIGSGQKLTLGSCWPLRFDIVPREYKESMREWIRASVDGRIGGYGGDAYYSGLYRAGGLGETIVADLERYIPMLESNRVNWETWTSGEYNHAWTAYPAYLFPKYIAGIQPTAGAFDEFDIRPEITGLQWAMASVPTVKGDIEVRWSKVSPSRWDLTCSVPPNSTARVFFPKLQSANLEIHEEGQPVWSRGKVESRDGVDKCMDTDEHMIVRIGSGFHHFEVHFQPD